MGYTEDIQIDIDHLDAEWIQQASRYQFYAKREAIAMYERDQVADELSLCHAKLDASIRLNPEKFGIITKPTEAAILNTIKQQPEYAKTNKAFMDLLLKTRIISAAVKSFEHKKKALEKLTDLYLSGYWAKPRVSSEAQEIYGKQAREEQESDLKKEERLITAGLKKEAEKDAKGKPEFKPTTQTGEGKAEGKAEAKPKGKPKPKAKAPTTPTGKARAGATASKAGFPTGKTKVAATRRKTPSVSSQGAPTSRRGKGSKPIGKKK